MGNPRRRHTLRCSDRFVKRRADRGVLVEGAGERGKFPACPVVALGGSEREPAGGLVVILPNALAVPIHATEFALGNGIALRRRQQEPAHGIGKVLLHTFAVSIGEANLALGPGMPFESVMTEDTVGFRMVPALESGKTLIEARHRPLRQRPDRSTGENGNGLEPKFPVAGGKVLDGKRLQFGVTGFQARIGIDPRPHHDLEFVETKPLDELLVTPLRKDFSVEAFDDLSSACGENRLAIKGGADESPMSQIIVVLRQGGQRRGQRDEERRCGRRGRESHWSSPFLSDPAVAIDGGRNPAYPLNRGMKPALPLDILRQQEAAPAGLEGSFRMADEISREMFDRLVDNVEQLIAEIDAVSAILVGVCAAMEKREMGRDIIADAFDFAERTQQKIIGDSDAMGPELARRTEGRITADPMNALSRRTLKAIASLRRAALD